MALQLLEHSKKSGDKTYRYYSVAEPYREGGKNKKRVLAHLGRLDASQVIKIRQALRIHNEPGTELIEASKLTCTGSFDYLALAVFHALFERTGLHLVVSPGTGDIELAKLLEILVLNRITAPQAKSAVPRWYEGTALPEILGIPSDALNESRFYRSLPGIDAHQEKFEECLFKFQAAQTPGGSRAVFFYDLTSSYFEGEEVGLAAFSAHSKDHRPDRMQVVLGLLINESGIPFSWDVFKGNQGDAPTLTKQLEKFNTRFGVKSAMLVFDRGFLSHDNLAAVELAGHHYLTGLRAPAIQTLIDVHPQPWIKELNCENAEEMVAKEKGWERYDETGFYCFLGTVNERKTCLLFDASRYRLAVRSRQKRIDDFKAWVVNHNEWLATFKKDASRDAIQKDVSEQITKRKLEHFVTTELHEYTTENETFQRKKNNPYPSQGHFRKVRSLQIIVKESNRDALDGVFALITSKGSELSAEEMIMAYRQKYLIENAFREMKSVLKLRPWFVYKMEHVRAHYTICVLAYALERMLDLLLEESGAKGDGWTLPRLKEELSRYRLVELSVPGHYKNKTLQRVSDEIRALLKRLGLEKTLKHV